MDKKLKIGVLGAGHLGKMHLRLLKESNHFDLVGFYDEQPQIAAKISREFGYRSFSDINQLLQAVDVVDIVTTTLTHFALAKKHFKMDCMCFWKNQSLQLLNRPMNWFL